MKSVKMPYFLLYMIVYKYTTYYNYSFYYTYHTLDHDNIITYHCKIHLVYL